MTREEIFYNNEILELYTKYEVLFLDVINSLDLYKRCMNISNRKL